ncbi:hypothetical protein DFQ28_004451 [Apophysomyces sp. BC1034]|nr:hypothetical protein DFQ30_005149 [Apophysomyces sp. BC1015]KAG0178439.1 hypothetical protein DFQ29_003450 [Apophysomyces sp. BC1021]KAG0188723.1 hypothetical protein DFQ28_004451 [Apophysomyces sp. BC1034]
MKQSSFVQQAMNEVEKGQQYQSNFTKAIDVICSTNTKIFQKAKASIADLPECAKVTRILDRGIQYNTKVKRRFSQVEDESSQESLDKPDYAPISSTSKSSATIEQEAAFIKKFRQEQTGKVSWKTCLA